MIMSCDQCAAMMINGVYCHETGCPNAGKVKVDGEWITDNYSEEAEYEQEEMMKTLNEGRNR